MNYMFVVAHPDDEVLGCGGLIQKLISKNEKVFVSIMNADFEKTRKEMFSDIEKSHKILGIKERSLYSFKNMNFLNENHREMVEVVEKDIDAFCPDYIFTHYWNDIHTDHQIVSRIVQQAARRSQRFPDSSKKRIRGLLAFEVLSSTDWGCSEKFFPDTYEEISEEGLRLKFKALEVYHNVVRSVPHPRSKENIYANAIVRGAEIGYKYAEAFKTIWRDSV